MTDYDKSVSPAGVSLEVASTTGVADEQTYLEFIRNGDEEGSVAYLKAYFEGNDEGLKEFVDKVMVIAQAEGEAAGSQPQAAQAPAEEASNEAADTEVQEAE